MCGSDNSPAEVGLALRQLQALAAHLEQAARQCADSLRRSGGGVGTPHLTVAIERARELGSALRTAEDALAGRADGDRRGVEVTPIHPRVTGGISYP